MFKFSLLLALIGMTILILAMVLNASGVNFEILSTLGAFIFLSAFVIIFFNGLISLLRTTLLALCHYFGKTSRSQRKLLYYLNQLKQQHSLFERKKSKILYNYQQKRHRLLKRHKV